MEFEPTILHDLVGYSNHWATGDWAKANLWVTTATASRAYTAKYCQPSIVRRKDIEYIEYIGSFV